MRILVTGAGGQLGSDVMEELRGRGHVGTGCVLTPRQSTVPYVQLDITDRAAVEEAVSRVHPDAVIHCAAWTAVDAAEDPENRAKVYGKPCEGMQAPGLQNDVYQHGLRLRRDGDRTMEAG